MNTRWIRAAGLAVSLVAAAVWALVLLASLARAERSTAPEAVTVPTLVSFQRRVTANGSAYNGVGYFKFAVVNAAARRVIGRTTARAQRAANRMPSCR